MKQIKLFIFLSLLNVMAFSQAAPVLNAEKKHKLDSFLTVMSANGLFNGSMAILEKGRVVYQRSDGYWNMERKILNSANTAFNLASVSKPFTALAILQLAKKHIRLDEPVARFFPGFPFKGVTVRNLLGHTSGLPNMERMTDWYVALHPQEVLSKEFIYSRLVSGKDTLRFPPGTRWDYNNINYLLLAMLVEKVSGQSFADYMRQNIFLPAKMFHTYIRQPSSPNTPRYLIPTFFDAGFVHVDSIPVERPVSTNRQQGDTYGSSNMVTTVEDMIQFDQAFFPGKIIPELLKEAFTPVVLENGKPASLSATRYYGLGWNILREPGKDTTVFHDGHIPGITAMYMKNLSRDITIIYYDNTESKGFFQKIGNIMRIMNDDALTIVPLKKSIVREYGPLLLQRGVDYALLKLHALRADTQHYFLDELQMNSLGYQFMGDKAVPHHLQFALEVFRLNTVIYRSANSFDSYGDALKAAGKKEEAILAYERCLELNPKTENAKINLAELKRAR